MNEKTRGHDITNSPNEVLYEKGALIVPPFSNKEYVVTITMSRAFKLLSAYSINFPVEIFILVS